MCGRYFIKLDDSIEFVALKKKIAEKQLNNYQENEVFPSQLALVLINGKGEYDVDVKRWGIDMNKGMLINARSESITEKWTFKKILKNRCVIVANGFYEWVKNGNKKEKIYIQKDKNKLMYLAGIFNEGNQFVILTGESELDMKHVHHRVPLILKESEIEPYLKGELELDVDCENLTFMNVG